MIRYHDESGHPCFIGIETKYTEPFSPKEYDNAQYRQVTATSDWFEEGAADALVSSSTNQLWRGLMLGSLTEEETETRGRYAVVTPADDRAAVSAVAAVKAPLPRPEERLRLVTVEDVIDAAQSNGDSGLAAWAAAFRRYGVRLASCTVPSHS